MSTTAPHSCGDSAHRAHLVEGQWLWRCGVCGKAAKFPDPLEPDVNQPNDEMARYDNREAAREQHAAGEMADDEVLLRALAICSGVLACLAAFGGAVYFLARSL